MGCSGFKGRLVWTASSEVRFELSIRGGSLVWFTPEVSLVKRGSIFSYVMGSVCHYVKSSAAFFEVGFSLWTGYAMDDLDQQ